ncbi:MAG: hypothetical protein ACP5PX_01520 [Candidatus Hadarchaeum sp.]|uniref:hypothetical protein n=1 Tax=Candidatus Hadarchaeum sp. TaxID=2883567 RepID=UPI003D148DA1
MRQGHLFLADTGFHRVLVWEDVEEAISGKWPPDVILGKGGIVIVSPESVVTASSIRPEFALTVIISGSGSSSSQTG